MTSKANKTCKYPELKVGDEVKTYRKKAITEKKEPALGRNKNTQLKA
jgi:hypothetical protein